MITFVLGIVAIPIVALTLGLSFYSLARIIMWLEDRR